MEGPARGAIDTRSLRELRGNAILYLVDYGTADDVLGYHERNLHGVPYGFVYLDLCAQLGDPWSATLSHEALELIAAPQANLPLRGYWAKLAAGKQRMNNVLHSRRCTWPRSAGTCPNAARER